MTITDSMGYRYCNRDFYCVDNEDCLFLCDHNGHRGIYDPDDIYCGCSETDYSSTGGCCSSTIHCSSGGYNCNIQCNGRYSCHSNFFYCGDNSICNIQCNQIYSCYKARFYCNDNSICNFYCKNDKSCSDSIFYCGDNSQCNIYCNGHESCINSQIQCGINSTCNIECDAHGQYGDNSTNKGFECKSMNINARNSKLLYVNIFNNNQSGSDMTIYAPNTNTTHPNIIKCGINTYDSTPYQYSCDSMDIYSVEGWNDVQLQINWMNPNNLFKDYTSQYNQMNCGDGYEYFCDGLMDDFLNNDMECHQAITICNNFTYITTTTTSSPTTAIPTRTPSDLPSTSPTGLPLSPGVTKPPTDSPTTTTEKPTRSPLDVGQTRSPSKIPTTSPTNTPSEQTGAPSKIPTTSPTHTPLTSGETESPSKGTVATNTKLVTTDDIADKSYYDYDLIVLYCFVVLLIIRFQ